MAINISFAGLVAWFRSKNITAHSVAVLAIGAATLYTTDEQFRDFVISAFQNHPKILADITFAVGIILKYSHSSSNAGTVANAITIQSSPNPPTATAVQAAQVSPEKP